MLEMSLNMEALGEVISLNLLIGFLDHVEDSLANGSLGIVTDIKTDPGGNVTKVMVKFDLLTDSYRD